MKFRDKVTPKFVMKQEYSAKSRYFRGKSLNATIQAYSGMFVIQSCCLYGSMEKRRPFSPGFFAMKVLRDLDFTFSSAFTSIGTTWSWNEARKSISIVELSTE